MTGVSPTSADELAGQVPASRRRQYSSLPLIFATTAAVVVCFLVGWFVWDTADTSDGSLAAVSDELQPAAPAEPPGQVAGSDSNDEPDGRATDINDTLDVSPAVTTEAPIDVESELRKARLAASADMLVTPPQHNALYFYGRVLGAQPEHDLAKRELDAVLAQVALQVSNHLANADYDNAYTLATLVERVSPYHPLVLRTRSAVAERADRMLASARRNAETGNDADAELALARAETLPGLDPAYLLAARASVEEARSARIQSELEQLEAERLAVEEASAEWAGRIRGAIKAGRLVGPASDNANDLLAQYDAPPESKSKLGDELVEALMAAGRESTSAGDIADAEAYIAAASGLRADAEGLADLRSELEQKIIEAEEAKILSLADFVRINTEPARYPRLATQLNATGWVDVLFTVTATGQTANIEVIQAEPESIFDRAAVEAVGRWTFQPREFRGRTLNQRASARLVFRLE